MASWSNWRTKLVPNLIIKEFKYLTFGVLHALNLFWNTKRINKTFKCFEIAYIDRSQHIDNMSCEHEYFRQRLKLCNSWNQQENKRFFLPPFPKTRSLCPGRQALVKQYTVWPCLHFNAIQDTISLLFGIAEGIFFWPGVCTHLRSNF